MSAYCKGKDQLLVVSERHILESFGFFLSVISSEEQLRQNMI